MVLIKHSGFFDAILQDPLLSTVKLIAEPWDIGPGGYQVGGFPAPWSEWNDQYRDSIRRRFGVVTKVCYRNLRDVFTVLVMFLSTVVDKPYASVNFLCSHDGLQLT